MFLRNVIPYYIILVSGVFLSGCETICNNSQVELYLIDSFSTVGHSTQIDEMTVVTGAVPLLCYSDFLSYDSGEYTFEITGSAQQKIEDLEHSTHGIAFAIKADNTLIYTGYFWPVYSSASCDWIVIDPCMSSVDNKLQVKLGYPGLNPAFPVPDRRNDERLLRIFRRDNKLK